MLLSGTVLEIAPMRFSLLLVALVLSVMFTVIEPEATAGMDLLVRFVFWVCHTGIGLIGILLASFWLNAHRWGRLPLVVSLGLTGTLGCLLASPFFYLICGLFPEDPPDEWLDHFASRGWMQGIMAKFLEASPMLLTSWYAVNAPLLFKRNETKTRYTGNEEPANDLIATNESENSKRLNDLYSRLPEVLGKELVAISSDLHYLNVYTTCGKTLILGSLKYYADALNETGIQVHRSSWVSKSHVVKVFMSGNEAWCLMSNGLKIPVSRSKRKDVKACFGQAVRTQFTADDISLLQ